MSKPEILYISLDGVTDPLGQSQILPYLSGLSQKGWGINLLSLEKKNRFKDHGTKVRAQLAEQNIAWYPLEYSKSLPLISPLINYLKLKREALRLSGKKVFRFTHCRSYLPAFIGAALKRKRGTKFIFDMRGFWADERRESGVWKMTNPVFYGLYHYLKYKEKACLHFSDYVIVLTEQAKQIIENWGIKSPGEMKIQIIPCCVDTIHFSKQNVKAEITTALKQRLNIGPDDFIISYLGSIGSWYLLGEMLDFFKVCLRQKGQSKFLFITSDAPQKILRESQKKEIPDDRIIICPAAKEDLPSLISLSRISLFFIQPCFSKKGSSPTKMGEALSMGVPVICNAGVGDIDRLMNKGRLGEVIHSFTSEEYERVASRLNAITNIPSEAIRKMAENELSLEMGIQRYHEVYSQII